MEGIKIEVTGNVARVIEKPDKITSGTIGLPVEFTFDSQWEGLTKVAVFRAGHEKKTVPNPEAGTTVPWELLDKPHSRLGVGVYGANKDGTIAIPTIWANVAVVQVGVDPEGDPTTDPTLPIWQVVLDEIDNVYEEMDRIVLEAAPIPDWNQEDPNGPGYIKNKPDLSEFDIDAVLYTEQTLTEEQQGQARQNINAVSGSFFSAVTFDLDTRVTNNTTAIGNNATAIENNSNAIEENATAIDNLNTTVGGHGSLIADLEDSIGDIGSALDTIIATQESIIGGESV